MSTERRKSIVMFPFMAQGHILPFMALARRILQQTRDHYPINFINTPNNIENLKSSLSDHENSSINLIEIPFSSTEFGLPPGSDNTDTLSAPLIFQFVENSHLFKSEFEKIISNIMERREFSPVCIISDMFFPWSAQVAHRFGIFHAVFNAGGGYGMAVLHYLWSTLPFLEEEIDISNDGIQILEFPKRIRATQIPRNLRIARSSSSVTLFLNGVFDQWLDSDGFLFNTVKEFDNIGLEYFREKLNKPVWSVGPVLENLSNGIYDRGGKKPGMNWDSCKNWLDIKPKNSVLYISFGSNATISASQMTNLAMALESSGKYFIWVVRPPLEFEITSNFDSKKFLPSGFEQRIQERGLLVENWAPQIEILLHDSICAFLSHCGWNSMIESLSNGVPMIAWPLAAEQHFNAKLAEEELGVCVQVAEGIEGEVSREEILEKIELVSTGKNMMKRKCREVRDIIRNALRDEECFKGSSVEALNDFLHVASDRSLGGI